jgi:hypothetical protein
MVGTRFYHGQRGLTIVEEFDGERPGDPPGYDYRYDGDTVTHWISAGALPIRFTKEPTTTTSIG